MSSDEDRERDLRREHFEQDLRRERESRERTLGTSKSLIRGGNARAAGALYGYDLGSNAASRPPDPPGLVRIGIVEEYEPFLSAARVWVTEMPRVGDTVHFRSPETGTSADRTDFEQVIGLLQNDRMPAGATGCFAIIAVDQPVRAWDVIYRRAIR